MDVVIEVEGNGDSAKRPFETALCVHKAGKTGRERERGEKKLDYKVAFLTPLFLSRNLLDRGEKKGDFL